MIETLYSANELSSVPALILSFGVGLAFGAALELAGFGSSRRLSGVFYFRDLTVVKVMMTAMVTAMLGILFLEQCGLLNPESLHRAPTFYGGAMIGGLLFGVGFVAGGWCPGTAAVGAASGKLDALLFLLAGMSGVWIYDFFYPFFRSLSIWGNAGVVDLPSSFGVEPWLVAGIITCFALAGLWVCELWEPENRKFTLSRFRSSGMLRIVTVLFLGMVFLLPYASIKKTDSIRLLRETVSGEDHISPDQLADILRNAPDSILLVDLRTDGEYRQGHLPGAVHSDLPDLPEFLKSTVRGRPIVLYSTGMVHPAQARNELIRQGFSDVRFLTDGLDGFLETVGKPASLRTGTMTPEELERLNWWKKSGLEGSSGGR